MKVSIQLLVLFVSLQLASVINAASIPVASPEESHNLAKRDADAGHSSYGYSNNYNYGRHNYGRPNYSYGNRGNRRGDALAYGLLGGIKGAILAPAVLAGKAAFLSALFGK